MPGEFQDADSVIATPAGAGGPLATLVAGPGPLDVAARLGAWLGGLIGRPLRFGDAVIAIRHAHVAEVLRRDLDFAIGPVNAARIDAVDGHFILGMDRGAALAAERGALYAALAAVDLGANLAATAQEADRLIAGAGGGPLDAVNGYARPAAAGTARRLFGVVGPDATLFMDAARAIFAHTFLNIGGDKTIEARALAAAKLARAWFDAEIGARRASGALGEDLMGTLMRLGRLDDDGVRRTLIGMLVGSIDTTATAVAKILVVLSRDKAMRAAATADAADPARLMGWCREALRRWPHNPVLLRKAAGDTVLAGRAVPTGATVLLWTQAAMRDASAFPDPGRMAPGRPAGAYLHFGGGLHPCAGRLVNDIQIPLLVGKILARGVARVGPVAWAGPFPDHLDVHFTPRAA